MPLALCAPRATVVASHDINLTTLRTQVCNPQAVIAAAAAQRILATLNGGGLICGDLAYANGNETQWDRWQVCLTGVQ